MSDLPLILVVDDENSVRMVVRRALAGMAHVLEADSAGAATEVIKKRVGIQLIITDIQMPGGSGVELHVAATAAKYKGPWLVMTGMADECQLAYFYAQRPQPRILAKPIEIAVLRRAVQEALESSRSSAGPSEF
ncbi:MAG: response regulator [bacterium]|nr:response regulator [bacterium]